MRRTFFLAAMTVLLILGSSVQASAQWWSWMEEYSGPGPFKGTVDSLFLTVRCFGERDPVNSKSKLENTLGLTPASSRLCFYIDSQGFTADADDIQGYPELNARLNDFGFSVPLHPAVDLGMGLGWIQFNAESRSRDIVTKKFAFTLARLVVKPVMLFERAFQEGQWSARERALASVLKVYFKQTYVDGPLTAAEFGAREDNTFRTNGEVSSTAGIVVDLFEVARVVPW